MSTVDAITAAVSALHHQSLFPASRGEHKGKPVCNTCTYSLDHDTVYGVWPCPTWQAVQAVLDADPPSTQVRNATAELALELMRLRVIGDGLRGGPEADDVVPAPEWLANIGGHLGSATLAVQMAATSLVLGDNVAVNPDDLLHYRMHLMAMAELALSAVESFDRVSDALGG